MRIVHKQNKSHIVLISKKEKGQTRLAAEYLDETIYSYYSIIVYLCYSVFVM